MNETHVTLVGTHVRHVPHPDVAVHPRISFDVVGKVWVWPGRKLIVRSR